ncbi:heme biosynthesis HemY N-terminal domain-containing protein [Algicola sagamiensis]|uniref:heme biosynthesis HemY N-terminal domain-containing protein n=1 Tax=Algicola sagamiensis TaxID=163869 RepID=UPI00037D97A1|nr:heme biosynthesis HemY N-terminal domain-containing protein [Algicola sagamiensis]
MKKILILFLFLVAMLGGSHLIEQKGYVVISAGDFMLETTLMNIAIFLLALCFVWVVLKWVFCLFFSGVAMPFRWLRQSHSPDALSEKAILAYLNGTPDKALEHLKKLRAPQSDQQWLLADLLSKAEIIDDSIQLLEKLDAKTIEQAIFIANCYLRLDRPEKALTTLKPWRKKNQVQLIQTYVRALYSQRDWGQLYTQLPRLEKYNAWNDDLRALFICSLQEQLKEQKGRDDLRHFWQQLSGKLRRHTWAQQVFIRYLFENAEVELGSQMLAEYFNLNQLQIWHEFLKHYSLSNANVFLKQIQQALKKDENNTQLLSALGHVAYHAKEYDLSQKALQKTVKLAPDADDFQRLADACAANNDQHSAIRFYQDANAS